jgi:hypothetical protein
MFKVISSRTRETHIIKGICRNNRTIFDVISRKASGEIIQQFPNFSSIWMQHLSQLLIDLSNEPEAGITSYH